MKNKTYKNISIYSLIISIYNQNFNIIAKICNKKCKFKYYYVKSVIINIVNKKEEL